MKNLYTLLIILVAIAQVQAQDRASHDRLSSGLELIGSRRNDYSQYESLNRFNYWNSRFDRYWAKCERVLSRDFGQRVLSSTRNLSAGRNDWSGDRYSTRNIKDVKRKEGLIKIN